MRDVYQPRREKLNERPVGRFLKSLDSTKEVCNDKALSYARNFVGQYGHLLHAKGSSFIARAVHNQDGTTFIPVESPAMADGLWLDLVVGKWSDKEQYTWRVSGGREQYDLEINEDYWRCIYTEMDQLNSVMRRYPVGDAEAAGIQLMVESITSCDDFKTKADNLTRKISNEVGELKSLETSRQLHNIRDRKRIESLRSSLFNAGFSAGSVDRSKIKPLISPIIYKE